MSRETVWAVRVECDSCGVVRVLRDDVVLRLAEHDGTCEVRYLCPRCEQIQLQPVLGEHVMMLLGAGIAVESWTLPAPAQEFAAPVLDEADVTRALAILADDELFAGALESLKS